MVEGFEGSPCEVTIDPPADELCKGWRVATTLPAQDVRPAGFGSYRADSYLHLVDHPVEMGTWESVELLAEGVPHQMVITGRARVDRAPSIAV